MRTDKTVLCAGVKPYQIAARTFLERIKSVVERVRLTRVALIFEESSRTDRFAEQFFQGYKLQREINSVTMTIPIDGFFMPKSSCEPGLEVADFIMHAAGTQTRAHLAGTVEPKRKDFMATFQTVDDRLQSFFRDNEGGGGKGVAADGNLFHILLAWRFRSRFDTLRYRN
jgi:hypothetical protein